ncbi:MAG: DUF5621 domain-containing protein [Gammaproteobacteria bacterium]|nr:DUF5621 domain-containing protein [Gammaproteobacteria bacterium]
MPKSTVSITFLGTQQHRDTHASGLVGMYNQIQVHAQQPGSDVAAILIDGVGCKGTAAHPMPGTYVYQNGQKRRETREVISQRVNSFAQHISQKYNALTGEGALDTVLEAAIFLEEIIQKNGGVVPEQVNLQGFSRGADSCVRMANVIRQYHPEIKVNLFLVDNVPGPNRRDDLESYIIPDNVESCNMVLMLNEHKEPLKPQHYRRFKFTNTRIKLAINYFAGKHGAGLTTNYGKNSRTTPPETQTLTQDLLLKFNIEHGSLPVGSRVEYTHISTGGGPISMTPLVVSREALTARERFGQLCEAMEHFKALAKRPVMKSATYAKRYIFANRDDYLLNPELFLDPEHRALFKAVYPACFNWFFEAGYTSEGGRDSADTRAQVFEELQQLRQDHKTFYDNFLATFGMKDTKFHDENDLIDPQGIPRMERLAYNQPLVTDELTYLQFVLRSIVDKYHYRAPKSDKQSDQYEKEIRETLKASLSLPDTDAKAILRHQINRVKRSVKSSPSKAGMIAQETCTIIPDSDAYMCSVLRMLQRYQRVLPETQARLVAQTIHVIRSQMEDHGKDGYDKRLEVQQSVMQLHSKIYQQKRADKYMDTSAFQRLSHRLNRLTTPSYAEHRLIDDMIKETNSYLSWQSFLACFPTIFGWHKPEKFALAQRLLVALTTLKAREDSNDLFLIKATLEEFRLEYGQLQSPAGSGGNSDQSQPKADTLSTFFDKHIGRLSALTADPMHHASADSALDTAHSKVGFRRY